MDVSGTTVAFPRCSLSSEPLACVWRAQLCRSVTPAASHSQVSGYPGSHGVTATAGSIYPGQASLLDQTDSWNHRPQEISMWQPNVEVSWMFVCQHEALPKVSC